MQQPGSELLRNGQTFYLECGASSSRYAAATLRTDFCGKAHREVQELHDAALACFLELENSLRPGVESAALDKIGSVVLGKYGHQALRLSKFGYSLGIAFSPGWGEASAFDIDPSSTAVLEQGMVLHLVVTLMSPVWGTVGLSETFEITHHGCTSLTPLDRNLVVVRMIWNYEGLWHLVIKREGYDGPPLPSR